MKIAVIGGIGSGKSYVINLIADLGERVCDCDAIYKEIAATQEYVNLVSEYFDAVEDGVIDRERLAKIVFSDRKKLELLNSLAHPLVFERIEQIYKNGKGNLYVEVSAYDKSMASRFDKIILVDCDKELRITRVIDRSGYSRDYIEKVIQEQTSLEDMKEYADYVIVNDCDKENLKAKVKAVIDAVNQEN